MEFVCFICVGYIFSSDVKTLAVRQAGRDGSKYISRSRGFPEIITVTGWRCGEVLLGPEYYVLRFLAIIGY
jgi:hypothetical protein